MKYYIFHDINSRWSAFLLNHCFPDLNGLTGKFNPYILKSQDRNYDTNDDISIDSVLHTSNQADFLVLSENVDIKSMGSNVIYPVCYINVKTVDCQYPWIPINSICILISRKLIKFIDGIAFCQNHDSQLLYIRCWTEIDEIISSVEYLLTVFSINHRNVWLSIKQRIDYDGVHWQNSYGNLFSNWTKYTSENFFRDRISDRFRSKRCSQLLIYRFNSRPIQRMNCDDYAITVCRKDLNWTKIVDKQTTDNNNGQYGRKFSYDKLQDKRIIVMNKLDNTTITIQISTTNMLPKNTVSCIMDINSMNVSIIDGRREGIVVNHTIDNITVNDRYYIRLNCIVDYPNKTTYLTEVDNFNITVSDEACSKHGLQCLHTSNLNKTNHMKYRGLFCENVDYVCGKLLSICKGTCKEPNRSCIYKVIDTDCDLSGQICCLAHSPLQNMQNQSTKLNGRHCKPSSLDLILIGIEFEIENTADLISSKFDQLYVYYHRYSKISFQQRQIPSRKCLGFLLHKRLIFMPLKCTYSVFFQNTSFRLRINPTIRSNSFITGYYTVADIEFYKDISVIYLSSPGIITKGLDQKGGWILLKSYFSSNKKGKSCAIINVEENDNKNAKIPVKCVSLTNCKKIIKLTGANYTLCSEGKCHIFAVHPRYLSKIKNIMLTPIVCYDNNRDIEISALFGTLISLEQIGYDGEIYFIAQDFQEYSQWIYTSRAFRSICGPI
ncbi:hypothetical protein GJ496_007008 [Pomphorhynchus laevis]|nr:hypothetical protein GJ496_007008 [Pomphorhynchus laevis]